MRRSRNDSYLGGHTLISGSPDPRRKRKRLPKKQPDLACGLWIGQQASTHAVQHAVSWAGRQEFVVAVYLRKELPYKEAVRPELTVTFIVDLREIEPSLAEILIEDLEQVMGLQISQSFDATGAVAAAVRGQGQVVYQRRR